MNNDCCKFLPEEYPTRCPALERISPLGGMCCYTLHIRLTRCVCFLCVQPTLTDVTLVTKEEDLPDDLYAPGLKLFVCSTNAALQRKVVDACDTLTTSLGPVSFHPLDYTKVTQDGMA